MTRYGYARVSTKDQKLDRQIEALVNAGVAYERIFKDKETGAREGDRTQQKKLFKKMKRGDEVVVESWERLTRSTRQLLNYDLMFRNLGVKLISLKQPVDLDTAFGRFVLGTHACTAELERDLINGNVDKYRTGSALRSIRPRHSRLHRRARARPDQAAPGRGYRRQTEPRWQRRGPPAHRGRQGRRCREALPRP